MSTTTRAEELTAQFEKVNAEAAAIIEDCGAEDWSRTTAAEGWTVAATAHHIASVQQRFASLVGMLAAGETFSPTMTMDQVHAQNARHAREYAAADKDETLELLHASRDEILGHFRALTDDALERHAGTFGGNDLTVGQVLENIIIGHPRDHLASIRETLGD
ncbi:MAG TPA: DinB family protein [Thermomicrobiales bacterium]|nr:DinB family protein [Thermomicrobiales bacterium]